MQITIAAPPRGGEVAAISSKSHAHRLLIAAALADGKTEIACGEVNDDILATTHCLEALGARIAYNGGSFSVTPIPRPLTPDARILECGESGSTLRFMLPVACALGANASFAMRARLPQRPLSPLYEELAAHGCALSPQGSNPLAVSGQLTGGVYTIAGNVSSQFITGLLLALPLLAQDSRIDITGALESRPYVDITLQTLAEFGITIAERDGSFFVRGGQRFVSPEAPIVEGDWSNAACWLALGAITGGPVTVTGLRQQSPQGDKAILDLLAGFGAKVETSGSRVTVRGGMLQGIEVDARAYPDLVPILAAVALAAKGQTIIRNAARLRLKECDRLAGIANTLRTFGASVTELPDGLLIDGGQPLNGGIVSSEIDHRIVMMSAVASALCDGDVTILDAEAVNKSYPRFFDDFRALGGKTREGMA